MSAYADEFLERIRTDPQVRNAMWGARFDGAELAIIAATRKAVLEEVRQVLYAPPPVGASNNLIRVRDYLDNQLRGSHE